MTIIFSGLGVSEPESKDSVVLLNSSNFLGASHMSIATRAAPIKSNIRPVRVRIIESIMGFKIVDGQEKSTDMRFSYDEQF